MSLSAISGGARCHEPQSRSRELYVYYRVDAAECDAALERVRRWQRDLAASEAGLSVRVLVKERRADEAATFMEIYASTTGISTDLQERIRRTAASLRLRGERHVEVFTVPRTVTTPEDPPMPSFDPDWLDQQYNPSLGYADAPALFKRWADTSAEARANSACEIDVRFGNAPKETLDWFTPAPADRRGCVLVFIHGGYWRGSDKSAHSFLAPAFLEAGADVVLLNYDLCPGVAMQALTMQVVRGMAYVHRQLAARDIDPKRLVVAGHSAGGHLTAMMLSCDWTKVDVGLPADLVTHGLAISGLFELEPLSVAPFLKDAIQLDDAAVAQLSPARFPSPAGRLLEAVVGERESPEFHRQTRLLADAWGPTAVKVASPIEGKDHYTVLEELSRAGSSLHRTALRMLGLAPSVAP